MTLVARAGTVRKSRITTPGGNIISKPQSGKRDTEASILAPGVTPTNDASTTGSTGRVLAENMTYKEKRINRHMLLEHMINKKDVQESILDFFFMTTFNKQQRPWKIPPSCWSIVNNRLYAQNPYDKRQWRLIDACALIDIEDKRDLFYKHSIHKKRKREKQFIAAAVEQKLLSDCISID